MKMYISNKYLIIIFVTSVILALYLLRDTDLPTYNKLQEASISTEEIDEMKNIIRKGLIDGKETFRLKNKSIKSEEIFEIIFDVARNEPEIMYFSGAEYKRGKLKIRYSQSKSKLKKDQTALRLKRNEIIGEIMNQTMTDYEKVKAAHDYIIDITKYDCTIYDDCAYKDESYTAYGNLVLGVGVCEGYAKSLKYILDEVGVENQIVIGGTRDHKHAWNLVCLDGEYYHIDLTWDDPMTGGCEGVTHYTYFCLTDDDIAKTHFWNREKYPEARGEHYNYFRYNDLIVSNKDEFTKKITRAMLNKCPRLLIKYENYKRDNISLGTVMADIEQTENMIMVESYNYCIDECQGIFNIYFTYYDRRCDFLN